MAKSIANCIECGDRTTNIMTCVCDKCRLLKIMPKKEKKKE
jgi:hypothetical protein